MSFLAFREWALANGYADNLTIDRIDNNGNYCPENCRWVTYAENARNKSNNVVNKQNVIEIKNLINMGYTNKEIADKFNVDKGCISNIKNNKTWVDVDPTIEKVHIASIEYFRTYAFNNGIKQSDYAKRGQVWINNYMLSNGFKMETLFVDNRVSNKRRCIKENAIDIVNSSSKIIYNLRITADKKSMYFDLFYKPLL